MDIMLERMLSLIPRKPNGKYVHGEKKRFCEVIDAPTNIASEWEAGKTKSYRNYVYAVAAKYDVSVEWLRGETNDRGGTGKLRAKQKPAPIVEGELEKAGYYELTPENQALIDQMIEKLLKSQSGE